MRFKAVIFDLDGVLVSTDEQHYQGWKPSATGWIFPLTARRTTASAA